MDSPSGDDSESVIPILDFPLEITKMILVFILKPGTVYPQVGHQYDSSSEADAKISPPGFQILATCKLIYNIGFPIFYGENEFCLPRGPKKNADSYFSSLAPAHSSLIRRMVIKNSITDIDGSFLQKIGLSKDNGHPTHESSIVALENSSRAVSKEASQLWKAKINWVYDWHVGQLNAGNPGLLHLKLAYSGCHKAIVIRGIELLTMSPLSGSTPNDPMSVSSGLLWALREARSCTHYVTIRLKIYESEDRGNRENGMEKWLEGLRRAEDIKRLAKGRKRRITR